MSENVTVAVKDEDTHQENKGVGGQILYFPQHLSLNLNKAATLVQKH